MNDKEIHEQDSDLQSEDHNEKDHRRFSIKHAALLAMIIGIPLAVMLILTDKEGNNDIEPDYVIEESSADSSIRDESIAITLDPTKIPTALPSIDPDKRIIRENSRYLVFPDSYDMEMNSFPESFSTEEKDILTKALGDYAYEEGFKIETVEYAGALMSNASEGTNVFGLIFNGMDDFYVTAVRCHDGSDGLDVHGEYLFVMDSRMLESVRVESPFSPSATGDDREDPGGTETGSGTRTGTVTPRPTVTVTIRPTATPTPIPVPTSDYHPEMLEIRGIPDEIIDSIASAEEFRNSLYNFMYDNGIRGTVVTTDAYYEKYGDGIFDFSMSVSGKTIYGRYDADANEYYYSFQKFG